MESIEIDFPTLWTIYRRTKNIINNIRHPDPPPNNHNRNSATRRKTAFYFLIYQSTRFPNKIILQTDSENENWKVRKKLWDIDLITEMNEFDQE